MPSSSKNSAERIPPQNLDAEKSLLGAILISEEALPDITEILKPQDFYDERHRHIYNAMWNLYERHQPVDLLTVRDQLKRKKLTEKAGGSAYLSELANFVPTAAHAKAYAEIVNKAAVRRRLIAAAANITENAYDEESETLELLGEAERSLFEVSEQNVHNDLIPISDLLSETFDLLEDLHENKGSIAGYKTGYPDLDRVTAGFHKSDLIILAARPAMGKTALALNFASNVAHINNKAVLVFSLEMGKQQLINRMLSDASGIDSFKLETGNFSGDDFSQISEAMAELSELPIFIDDTPGLTVMEMRTKARRAAHDHEIGLIIVDYLQLMSGSSKRAIRDSPVPALPHRRIAQSTNSYALRSPRIWLHRARRRYCHVPISRRLLQARHRTPEYYRPHSCQAPPRRHRHGRTLLRQSARPLYVSR